MITTTVRTGHNPGDTFISVGLQYLFEQALGVQRWLLVDRFGPGGFRQHSDLIRSAPFLVYGGMPQYNNYDDWCHWYDDRMWRRFILRWGLHVFTMAGGAGFSNPDIGVQDYVAHCLRSDKTRRLIRQRVEPSLCFTVRDEYAHALLTALGIESTHLPCSATWASRMWRIEPETTRPHLFLVPPHPRHVARRRHGRRLTKSERASDYVDRWASLYRALKRRDEGAKILCHGYEERAALCHSVPEEDLWFHGDSFTLLRQYASAHTVVSARLHGSLPAYGIPGTRVVNIAVDIRGTAVGILPKIASVRGTEFLDEDICDLVETATPSSRQDLDPFEDAYVEVIRASMPG